MKSLNTLVEELLSAQCKYVTSLEYPSIPKGIIKKTFGSSYSITSNIRYAKIRDNLFTKDEVCVQILIVLIPPKEDNLSAKD